MQQQLAVHPKNRVHTLRCPQRRCDAVQRRQRLHVQCAASDYSIKIRGDIRKVYKYVSDMTKRPDWDSATLEAVTIKGRSAIGVGTSFALVQSPLPAVKVPVTYTVAEYLPPKKLVLTGVSETYKARKTFVFMEHPNQPQQTIVRQMFEISMTDWKAMIPMLESQLAKKEMAALKKLEALLNGPGSPLNDIVLTAQDLKPLPKPSTSSSNGTQQGGGWNLGSVFTSIFSGDANGNGNGRSASGSSYDADIPEPESVGEDGYEASGSGVRMRGVSDALGYYQVLGLQPSEFTTMDDIKSAYRKAAMQVHPDRMVGADEKMRKTAQIQFQILQAAYDTLKDSEKRKLYDRGQLMSVVE